MHRHPARGREGLGDGLGEGSMFTEATCGGLRKAEELVTMRKMELG